MSFMRHVVRAAAAGVALVFAAVGYSWVILPDVRPLKTRNPSSTAFMRLRAAESSAASRPVRAVWRWTSSGRIATSLKEAVIVSEDAAFWEHDGVDLHELRVSLEDSVRRATVPRGASTITQQLAKNLYLSPSRNPYRKLVELMVARRLEAELAKERILEIYLNVIEWGNGVWGAEAASRTYFGKAAAELSEDEAALLAAAIINPRLYSPARPNARLLSRQRIILHRLAGRRAVLAPAP